MTPFTITQSKENFLQGEKDPESISVIHNKGICILSFLNYRWLKILILNYLSYSGLLKCFLSNSHVSDLRTVSEHFSSRFCFLHLFLVHLHLFTVCIGTLCFTTCSQFCLRVPSFTQPYKEFLLSSWKSPQVTCFLRHLWVQRQPIQMSAFHKTRRMGSPRRPPTLWNASSISYSLKIWIPLDQFGSELVPKLPFPKPLSQTNNWFTVRRVSKKKDFYAGLYFVLIS